MDDSNGMETPLGHPSHTIEQLCAAVIDETGLFQQMRNLIQQICVCTIAKMVRSGQDSSNDSIKPALVSFTNFNVDLSKNEPMKAPRQLRREDTAKQYGGARPKRDIKPHHTLRSTKFSKNHQVRQTTSNLGKNQNLQNNTVLGLWNGNGLNNEKSARFMATLKSMNSEIGLITESRTTARLNGLRINGYKILCADSNVGLFIKDHLTYEWTILESTETGGIGLLKVLDDKGEWISIYNVYASPRSKRDPQILMSLLSHVDTRDSRKLIMAGDFNAPIGTERRRTLEAWLTAKGLSIVNANEATHHRPGTSASNLDLFISRNAYISYKGCQQSANSHHKVVFATIQSSIKNKKPKLSVQWTRLRNARNQTALINELETLEQQQNPLTALQTAGKATLRLGVRRQKEILPSIVERSMSNEDSQDCEEQNKLDLIEWTKEELARPHGIWKLLRDRKPTDRTSTQIKEILGDRYQHKAYKDEANCNEATDAIKRISYQASELDAYFSHKEVQMALQSFKGSKAPGPDGITNLAIRVSGQSKSFVSNLRDHYNALLDQTKAYPPTVEALLYPIPKGDSIRPIMIGNKEVLILERLIWQRIRLTNLAQFGGQYAFTTGRSTSGLLEEIKTHLQTQRKGIVISLDLSKAFDSIPKAYIIKCAAEKWRQHAPCGRLMSLIARMTLADRVAQIVIENGPTTKLRIQTGTPQGGILSPWIFICATDALRASQDRIPTQSKFLKYADDNEILTCGQAAARQCLRQCEEWTNGCGISWNPDKSVVLIGSRQRLHLTLDGKEIRIANMAKIVGRDIIGNGSSPARPIQWLPLVSKLARFIRLGLPPAIALHAVRAKFWTSKLYGSDVFAFPENQIRKIHHRIVRSLLSLPITTPSEWITEEIGEWWAGDSLPAYLRLPQGHFLLKIRLPSLNPGNGSCFKCGAEHLDTGRHILKCLGKQDQADLILGSCIADRKWLSSHYAEGLQLADLSRTLLTERALHIKSILRAQPAIDKHCIKCNRIISNPANRNRHEAKCNGQPVAPPIQRNVIGMTDFAKANRCLGCDIVFTTEGRVRVHLNSNKNCAAARCYQLRKSGDHTASFHRYERPLDSFPCSCGRTYTTQSKLTDHLRKAKTCPESQSYRGY